MGDNRGSKLGFLTMKKVRVPFSKLSPRFDRRNMMHADAIRLAPVLHLILILLTKNLAQLRYTQSIDDSTTFLYFTLLSSKRYTLRQNSKIVYLNFNA